MCVWKNGIKENILSCFVYDGGEKQSGNEQNKQN